MCKRENCSTCVTPWVTNSTNFSPYQQTLFEKEVKHNAGNDGEAAMILLCKRKKGKVCREPRNTKKKCKSCMIVVSGCIVLCFTLCKCPFMFLYVFPYEKKIFPCFVLTLRLFATLKLFRVILTLILLGTRKVWVIIRCLLYERFLSRFNFFVNAFSVNKFSFCALETSYMGEPVFYKWDGVGLSVVTGENLVTYGAVDIEPFTIHNQQYVAVANYVNDQDVHHLDSEVYMYNVLSGRSVHFGWSISCYRRFGAETSTVCSSFLYCLLMFERKGEKKNSTSLSALNKSDQ